MCKVLFDKNHAPVYTTQYNTNAICTTELPVPMRNTPALSVLTGSVTNIVSGTALPYSSFYVYHASSTGDAINNYQADAEL